MCKIIRKAWCILLLLQTIVHYGHSSSTITTASLSSTSTGRCADVVSILNYRLEGVLNGKRQRDFSKKYRKDLDKIDREYSVVSGHGRGDGKEEEVTPCDCTETEATDKVHLNKKSKLLVRRDTSSLELPDGIISSLSSRSNEPAGEPSVLELTMRACRLTFNFSPCICTSGLALLVPTFRKHVWFKLLATSFAKSGPAFIKWGQWASTRSDMIPEELCTALSQLHASAPMHPWSFTKSCVETSLGIEEGSLLDVFHSFDEAPIASGSIAQVHKAVLRHPNFHHHHTDTTTASVHSPDLSTGRVVALKVRHPNVERLINKDFRLMSILANIVDSIPTLRWLNVRSSVEQFSHTMAAQAHLEVEAHHLQVLNHNFRHHSYTGFPHPIFASSSVIIETFELGKIVSDYIEMYQQIAYEDHDLSRADAHQIIPLALSKFIVTNGLSIYLKMLLLDNLMHADLHPGNIMLYLPSSTAQPQYITVVDAGMVAQLTQFESINFIGLLCAIGEANGSNAAKFVLRFSSSNISRLSITQISKFTQDVILLFEEECHGYGSNVQLGDLLRSILILIRKHHVRVDANYATLIVNALCVEGLSSTLVPSYNLLDASRPFLIGYKKICQDGQCHKSVIRLRLLRRFMSLIQMYKHFYDYFFFEKLDMQRRRTVNIGLKTRLGNGVKAIGSAIVIGNTVKNYCSLLYD